MYQSAWGVVRVLNHLREATSDVVRLVARTGVFSAARARLRRSLGGGVMLDECVQWL